MLIGCALAGFGAGLVLGVILHAFLSARARRAHDVRLLLKGMQLGTTASRTHANALALSERLQLTHARRARPPN